MKKGYKEEERMWDSLVEQKGPKQVEKTAQDQEWTNHRNAKSMKTPTSLTKKSRHSFLGDNRVWSFHSVSSI